MRSLLPRTATNPYLDILADGRFTVVFQKCSEEFQSLCRAESLFEVSRATRQERIRHCHWPVLVLGACSFNYVVSGCQALRNALVLSPWPWHELRSIAVTSISHVSFLPNWGECNYD